MDNFLTQNSFVLKLLTRKHEIKNLKNIQLILENEEFFEVYLEYPELNYETLWKLFPQFIIVQQGEYVKSKKDICFSEEALVLRTHPNDEKYDIFLIPAAT